MQSAALHARFEVASVALPRVRLSDQVMRAKNLAVVTYAQGNLVGPACCIREDALFCGIFLARLANEIRTAPGHTKLCDGTSLLQRLKGSALRTSPTFAMDGAEGSTFSAAVLCIVRAADEAEIAAHTSRDRPVDRHTVVEQAECGQAISCGLFADSLNAVGLGCLVRPDREYALGVSDRFPPPPPFVYTTSFNLSPRPALANYPCPGDIVLGVGGAHAAGCEPHMLQGHLYAECVCGRYRAGEPVVRVARPVKLEQLTSAPLPRRHVSAHPFAATPATGPGQSLQLLKSRAPKSGIASRMHMRRPRSTSPTSTSTGASMHAALTGSDRGVSDNLVQFTGSQSRPCAVHAIPRAVPVAPDKEAKARIAARQAAAVAKVRGRARSADPTSRLGRGGAQAQGGVGGGMRMGLGWGMRGSILHPLPMAQPRPASAQPSPSPAVRPSLPLPPPSMMRPLPRSVSAPTARPAQGTTPARVQGSTGGGGGPHTSSGRTLPGSHAGGRRSVTPMASAARRVPTSPVAGTSPGFDAHAALLTRASIRLPPGMRPFSLNTFGSPVASRNVAGAGCSNSAVRPAGATPPPPPPSIPHLRLSSSTPRPGRTQLPTLRPITAPLPHD